MKGGTGSPLLWIHFGVKYDEIWLDTHEIQCDSFAFCIATPASTEKVGFSNTLKETNGIKTQSKGKFAKKPPDMKNHQNKRNKKQTNANVEFPRFFCFCAHFFIVSVILVFQVVFFCLLWSCSFPKSYILSAGRPKTIASKKTQKQSHHTNICYKRKQRAENV